MLQYQILKSQVPTSQVCPKDHHLALHLVSDDNTLMTYSTRAVFLSKPNNDHKMSEITRQKLLFDLPCPSLTLVHFRLSQSEIFRLRNFGAHSTVSSVNEFLTIPSKKTIQKRRALSAAKAPPLLCGYYSLACPR